MKKFLIASALCLPSLVFAESVFKCQTNSGTVYQSNPCPQGVKSVNISDNKVNSASQAKKTNRRNAFIDATIPKTWSTSFEDCEAQTEHIKTLTDEKVLDIVDSSGLKITKFCDGKYAVTVSCSRPDKKMVIKMTDNTVGCH